MATLLTKSLDEMIKEQKKDRPAKGGKGGKSGKGGKGAKGGKGDKPKPGAPAARQAGGRASRPMASMAAPKASPYQAAGGKGGRGGGAARGPVIERKIVQGPAPKNRVFVTRIPYDWNDRDIMGVMATVGEVEKLTLFSDDRGRPTGNAVVSYRTEQGAKRAIDELDGAALGSQEIAVSYARGDEAPKGGRGGAKGAPAHSAPAKGGKGGAKGQGKGGKNGAPNKSFGRAAAGGKGSKGSKGGKGGKAGKSHAKVERKEVSRAQLDAELAKYMQ